MVDYRRLERDRRVLKQGPGAAAKPPREGGIDKHLINIAKQGLTTVTEEFKVF